MQKLHKPQIRDKAIVFDKPWEGAFSGYSSVFKYENTYYAYDRGTPYQDIKNPIIQERKQQVT